MTNTYRLLQNIFLACALLLPVSVSAADETGDKRVLRGPAELMLWVKGENVVGLKDGAQVEKWTDSSGRGNHLTSEETRRPTFKTVGIGGKPALLFAADGKKTNRVDAPWTNQEWHGLTMFVVATNLPGASWLGTSGGMGDIRIIGGGIQHCNTEIGVGSPFGDQQQDTPHLCTLMEGLDRQGQLHLSTYVDGKPQGYAVSKQHDYSVTMHKTMWGAYGDWDRGLNGLIAEIIVYRGPLADDQRAMTEGYLMNKYKLGSGFKPATAPWGYPIPALVKAQVAVKSLPPIKAAAPDQKGLLCWFSADQVKQPEVNGPIREIPNLAGDRKPIVSTGNDHPLYIPGSLGNRPVMRFVRGKGQRLKLNLSPGVVEAMTIMVVGRNLTGDGFLDTAPKSSNTLRGNAKGYQFCGGPMGGGGNPLLQFFTDGQLTTMAFQRKEDGSSKIAAWAHGAAQGNNEAGKGACPTPFKIEDMHIGVQNIDETWFSGDVAEVLIWDRWLSDVERKGAEQYLAEKYTLLLADDKTAATARSRYSLRYPQIPSRQSWMQNTFPGKDSWVQTGVFDMVVLPDGTVLCCSVWDEMHKEIGFYKDGKPVMVKADESQKMNSPLYNKGIFNMATGALCVSATHIYAGISGMGKPQIGLRRFRLSDLQEDPFQGTEPGATTWIIPKTPDVWHEFTGMVVVEKILYATYRGSRQLRLIDAEKATEISVVEFPEQPGRVVGLPKTKTLWIALSSKVIETDLVGKATGREIRGVTPGGLAIDPQGRLLVADNGKRMQVIYYDISAREPKEVDTLGEPGGIWKAKRPGEMGPNRFYDFKAISSDQAGNVYVHCGGNLTRGYGPDKKMSWQMEATSFCSVGDVDPASDGDEIHSVWYKYGRRPAAKPGESEWEWRGVHFTPSQDKWREGTSDQYLQMRRIGGRLFKYQVSSDLRVWEQLPGAETFVPRALWAGDGREWKRPAELPKGGIFAWCDLNGDGQASGEEITTPAKDLYIQQEQSYDIFVDSAGGLWEPKARQGIRYLPMKKLGEHGPIYDVADVQTMQRPVDFVEVNRVMYYPESDTMYISGQTWESAARSEYTYGWGLIGREIIRYADWSKPTRREVSRMIVPAEVESPKTMAISQQNELCFIGDMTSSVVFVYDTRNGKLLGIVEADRRIFGMSGAWIDQGGGLRAFTRKNGEVMLLVEDSGWGKGFVFTLPAKLPGR